MTKFARRENVVVCCNIVPSANAHFNPQMTDYMEGMIYWTSATLESNCKNSLRFGWCNKGEH